nr:S8 family peptidase [Bacillus timonensis]
MAVITLLTPLGPKANAEVPTEKVIIVFKDNVDKQLVNKVNGEIDHISKNVPVLSGEIPTSAITQIENDQAVLAVETDQVVKVSGQVQDWGIENVKAPKAWQTKYTGSGTKIAIIDTGISQHEDLVIAGGISFTSYTTSYSDDNGHGTHVAGIVGAKNNQIGTVGVAPEASIYAVKVLGADGSGYLSDIISGLDWAITNDMDIINLSLGSTGDSLALKQAVDRAYSKGILVVASAGNSGNTDGNTDSVLYPAKYASTIAVSAVDIEHHRGTFSSTGKSVEIAAPGIDILSTYLKNQYVKMDGTSMAAPYVTGILALLKQAYPTLSHIELREKLQTTALDLGTPGRDTFFGYGLAQAPTESIEAIPVAAKPSAPKPVVNPVPKQTIAKPVSKPIVKKKMISTITTAKTVYNVGNTIWPTVKVIDSKTRKPLPGAIVKLTIIPPKGKAVTITVKSNSKGIALFKYITTKKSVKGTYKLSTSINLTNYATVSQTKTVRLK